MVWLITAQVLTSHTPFLSESTPFAMASSTKEEKEMFTALGLWFDYRICFGQWNVEGCDLTEWLKTACRFGNLPLCHCHHIPGLTHLSSEKYEYVWSRYKSSLDQSALK